MKNEERTRIEETIARLESRLRASSSLPNETRAELIALLGNLKQELAASDETAGRPGVAGYTDMATTATDEGSVKGALADLAGSVEGFEESHPQLVEVVNRIATTLSSLGI